MTRNVLVKYHREDGTWWADSDDVDGFTAVGSTLDETRGLVREGIGFYLEGEDVRIIERTEDGAALDVQSLVSVPRTSWWTIAGSTSGGFAQALAGPGPQVTKESPVAA